MEINVIRLLSQRILISYKSIGNDYIMDGYRLSYVIDTNLHDCCKSKIKSVDLY